MSDRIILAYSGSLPTSAAIPWLVEAYRAEVTTLTLDLGQGRDLEEFRARAVGLGATRAHALDVREEFARGCMLPALRSGPFHGAPAPTGGTLAHPLIAAKLVEIAAIEQAGAVAHGARGSDGGSIERAVHALNPRLHVIPAGVLADMGVTTLAAFARAHGLPAPGGGASGRDIDCTLWGRIVTYPPTSAEWAAPSERAYRLTRPTAQTPEVPAHVELEFDGGVPVTLNGVPMGLTELIECVATIAGNHGVGRVAYADSGRVYEAPAAMVLAGAHDALASAPGDRPTGLVRIKLFRGEQTIVGHSPVAVQPSLLIDQHT